MSVPDWPIFMIGPGAISSSHIFAVPVSVLSLGGQSEPAATNAPVGRSVHWMGCIFHSALDGVHLSPFLFAADHCTFFFGSWPFFPGPDLTHSYLAHFFTFIGIATTLVPYLLSPTDTATLITSYPIDLATVLTTYPTNLATLLITYPTNLTTILTT